MYWKKQAEQDRVSFFFFCQCLTAVLSTLGKAKGSNYSMPGMASATSINLDSEQVLLLLALLKHSAIRQHVSGLWYFSLRSCTCKHTRMVPRKVLQYL